MSEQFPPSWLERVFDRAVRDEIFEGHTPEPGEPILVLLGGQPAAGKTHAQNSVILQHPEDDLVPITGDDLRRFTPSTTASSWMLPWRCPERPLQCPED